MLQKRQLCLHCSPVHPASLSNHRTVGILLWLGVYVCELSWLHVLWIIPDTSNLNFDNETLSELKILTVVAQMHSLSIKSLYHTRHVNVKSNMPASSKKNLDT